MRGKVWIASTLVLLVLIPAALLAGAQEPRSERQTGDTRLSPENAVFMEWSGTSALSLAGACLVQAGRCVGDAKAEDGAFFLPASALDGRVVVSWRPANESLRTLRVEVAGVTREAESPIVVDFTGLDAGQHLIHIAPARQVVGSYRQEVDWSAGFLVSPASDAQEINGHSGYRTTAGCALVTCETLLHKDSGGLVIPWTPRGTLEARWDPNDGGLRLSLRGTDRVAEGVPPLTLDLGGLEPGEYPVDVGPVTLALPTEAYQVSWTARLARG